MWRWYLRNKFTNFFNEAFTKIKNSKAIQILLFVALILIVVLIYFSLNNSSKQNNMSEQNTTSNYAEYLEVKLENVLQQIKDVGTVNVAITLESGYEYIYATEEEIKETSTGTLTTTSIVLVSGKPIIIKEIPPKIKGVVVVASGAENISVRMNILCAIQTALEVDNEKITILN